MALRKVARWWWPERLVARVRDGRWSSYISDLSSELASSSNTLTRTWLIVSPRVNALAHQVTLSTEPDESRCFAMGVVSLKQLIFAATNPLRLPP